MLFRRRDKNLWASIQAFIWPKKGVMRGWIYLMMRILRIRSSDYSLSAGFAAGVAVSFTPLIGLHFILGIALAWLIRGNMIMSMIGTAIGNPWTFPLIWALIYAVGTSVLGRSPGDTDVTTLSYELLLNSPGEVMVSMFTGGLIMGGIFGVISFLLAYVFAGRIRMKLLSIKRNRLKKMVIKRAQHG